MALGSNIDSWLAKKYSIQQQNATTNQTEGIARAHQTDVASSLAPGLAGAQEAQAYGAGAQGQGAGALSRANVAEVPGLASSERLLHGAQASLFGSQAGISNLGFSPANPLNNRTAQDRVNSGSFNGVGAPTDPLTGQPIIQTFSTGTAKVPGKGSGKVDTQEAMLAPGEAVLNKAAAEHLGRGTIALLNAIGRQKMGMPEDQPGGSSAGGDTMGYAGGGTMGYAGGTNSIMPSAPGQQSPNAPAPQRGDQPVFRPMTAGGTPVFEKPPGYASGTSNIQADAWAREYEEFRNPNGTATRQDTTAHGGASGDAGGGGGDTGSNTPRNGGGGKTPGYAKGTAKVPGKASPEKKASPGKKASPKSDPMGGLSPGILQALLSMGGGAGGPPPPMGGMPGPGAQPQMPMPMPMPQVMPR